MRHKERESKREFNKRTDKTKLKEVRNKGTPAKMVLIIRINVDRRRIKTDIVYVYTWEMNIGVILMSEANKSLVQNYVWDWGHWGSKLNKSVI